MIHSTLEQLKMHHAFYDVLLVIAALIALIIVLAFRAKDSIQDSPTTRLFWVATIAAAVTIRLPLMSQQPWYDETFTSAVVQTSSLNDMWTVIMSDVHPPAFYALARLATALPFVDDMFAMRLPSLLAGLVLIPMAYQLNFRFTGNHRRSRYTAMLTTFMPSLVYFSAEARYPALLAVALIGAFLGILEDKPRWFVVGAVGAAWLHALGIIGSGMLLLIAFFKARRRRWLFAVLITALGVAAWLPFAYQQSTDVANGFWLELRLPVWHIVDSFSIWALDPVTLVIIMIGAFLLAFWAIRHAPKKNLVLWVLVALGIPVAVWWFSFFYHPVYLSRGLLAAALVMFVPAIVQRWQLVVILAISAIGIAGIYKDERSSEHEALIYCNGSTAIYTNAVSSAIVARYYYPQAAIYTDGTPTNGHQWLSPAALGALHIQSAIEEPDGACTFYQLDWYTTEDELNHLASRDVLLIKATALVSFAVGK